MIARITGGGSLTNRNILDLNSNFAALAAPFTPGNVIWCNPASSNLSQPQDGSQSAPFTDLGAAYSAAVGGRNDVIVLVGDGATGASARLTSTLTWAKNATHLVGYAAPSYNPRARLATLSGASAFAQFVTVTASGCRFENFGIFNDNAIAAQITWTDQGGRNYYGGVMFGGMGDTTSAASATSRVLKLGGSGASGENVFENCTIGLDTISRSAANASVEFAGGSKRNIFRNCLFPSIASAGTPLYLTSSGTNPLETFQLFENCTFLNQQTGGSGTALAAVATLDASGNGQVVLRNCSRFNVTDWGTNATSNGQIFVDGPATGATDDIGRGAVAIAT